MRGKYTFKQDGRVVAESENLITTAGKRVIIDYIAGYTQRIAGAILLGIGNTAASLSDKSLNFEVSRVPVDLASADYSNNAVVFKGQVPAEQSFTVYETGIQTLYVTGQEFGSMMLLDFDSSSDDWSEGTFVTTNSRTGEALQLTSTASTSKTANLPGLFYDLVDTVMWTNLFWRTEPTMLLLQALRLDSRQTHPTIIRGQSAAQRAVPTPLLR